MKRIFKASICMILCVSVANVLPVKAAEIITIDEKNFPDAVFRSEVTAYDLNKDNSLDADELGKVTTIDCSSKSISSLKGIEYFTSLQVLTCTHDNLSSLDITKNINLTELDCSSNHLTALNTSANTALQKLTVNYNEIMSFDLKNNLALTNFSCIWNYNSFSSLSSLDVSKNKELKELIASMNDLTSIDVSNNLKLEKLDVRTNEITSIDVSKNTSLNYLDCAKNKLTKLDITNNTKITHLMCYKNQLTSLDLSKNAELYWMLCEENQFSSLDISKNQKLYLLNFSDNKLTSLDFSNNPDLDMLYCDNNQLASLDFSNNPKLGYLTCKNNQLKSLDVTKHDHLVDLYCSGNQLTSLNVKDVSSLWELDCSGNQLTSIDLGDNSFLPKFDCSDNKLISLDVSKVTEIANLYCEKNQLSSLDVRNNTALENLNCSNNKLASLDVSNNIKLEGLNCCDNLITSLDVSKNTLLTDIYCTNNKLRRINVSNNAALNRFQCENNQIAEIDVSANTKLSILQCSDQTRETNITAAADGKYQVNISSMVNDLSKVTVPSGETIENGIITSDSDSLSYNYEIVHTPVLKTTLSKEVTYMHVILNQKTSTTTTVDDLYQNHPEFLIDSDTDDILQEADIAANECLRNYTETDEYIMALMHNLKFSNAITELINHMISVDGNDYSYVLANEKCAQKYIAELSDASTKEMDKRYTETLEDAADLIDTKGSAKTIEVEKLKLQFKESVKKNSSMNDSEFSDSDLDDFFSDCYSNVTEVADTVKDAIEIMEVLLHIYDVDTKLLDKSIEVFSTNEAFCYQLKKIKLEHFASPDIFIVNAVWNKMLQTCIDGLADAIEKATGSEAVFKVCSVMSDIVTEYLFDNVTISDYLYTIIMGGNYVLSSTLYNDAAVKIQLAQKSREITDADVEDFKQRFGVQMAMTKAYLKQLASVEDRIDEHDLLLNEYKSIDENCTYEAYFARCLANEKNEINPDAVTIKQTETKYGVPDLEPRTGTAVDDSFVPNKLKITFNTPVTLGSGSIKLYEINPQGGADTLVASTEKIELSSDGKTATFGFSCTLSKNTDMCILIDSGLFISKLNPQISFAGISNNSTWRFKVIDNTEYYPISDFGALAASQFAYQDILPEDVGLTVLEYAKKHKTDDFKYYIFKQELSNWIIQDYREIADNGAFCGIVLKNKYKNSYVLTFRGSTSLNGKVKDTDLEAKLRKWTNNDFSDLAGALEPEYKAAGILYDNIKNNNPNANIMLTGHSLGGTIANYVSYTRNVRARTFNSLYCMADTFAEDPDDSSKYFTGIDSDDEILDKNRLLRIDYVNKNDDKYSGFIGMNNHENKVTYEVTSTSNTDKAIECHELYDMIHVSDKDQHIYALNNISSKDYLTESSNITKSGVLEVGGELFGRKLVLGYHSNDEYSSDKDFISGLVSFSSDAVYGGDGNDTFYTFKMDDTLVGGKGNDNLHGGDGNDLYVYNNGDGVDYIEDPQGKDVIHINGYTSSDVLNKYIDPDDSNYLDITINSKVIMKVNLNKQVNSSIDIVYNNSSESINCDTYIKYHPLLWLQKYACPVKVQFINSNGEVVAELGNEEKQIINEYGYFYSIKNQDTGEYEKTAYVFGDLKTKVIGTDTGTMDMSTEKVDDSNNSYVVQNVPVNTDTVVDVTAAEEDTKPTILMSSSNGASTLNPIEHNESSTETIVPVSSISLGNLNAMVNISRTIQLNAGLEPSNATDPTVVWSSSDTSVASVDQNGTVLGLKKGSTVITATSGNGYKATSNITVLQGVSGISLSETAKTLNINDTLSLSATVYPADASNTNYTWSSSNDSVASVSNGTVTAKAGGTAIITATTADGSHQASCTVTVNYPPAPAVEPTPVPASVVEKNDMYRLYNPNSGEHFFTANSEERDYLSSIGWTYEGVAWSAPKTSNTPVYRLYNGNGGEHHYTTSMEEANVLTGIGWSLEGIGWYSDDAQGQPLYRMYNPNAFANNHHYTTSEDERDYLVSIGWSFEGTGWYGCN